MNAPRRYQVNPDLRVSHESEQIVIEASSNTYSLSDNALWPFISGVISSKDEIVVPEEDSRYSAAELERLDSALEILVDTEILVPSLTPDCSDTVVSLSNRSGGIISTEEIAERLQSAKIVIVDPHGSSVVSTLTQMILDYPVQEPEIVKMMPTAPSADLMIVVASDEHDPVLDEANRIALDSDVRVWAPLTPARSGRFRIGPWMYPNQSACYKCFRLRAGSIEREPLLADMQREGQSAVPSQDRFRSQPAMTSMMLSILTDAVVTHLALDGAQGQAPVGGIVYVDYGLEGFDLSNHRVLRVPRCPECSPAAGTGYPQIWFHEE